MSKIENFLIDTLILLKEQALEARYEYLQDKNDEFKMGISFGYYEVFRLITEQAKSFHIPLGDISLNDIDVEKDLLGLSNEKTDKV